MKIFKRLGIATFLLTVVLTVVVVLGSRDAAEFDDQGLAGFLSEVQSSENGYMHISYLDEDRFKLFEDKEVSRRLKKHVTFEEWDSDFVTSTLQLSKKYLKDAIAAQDKPFFKLPTNPEDATLLPSFVPVMDMSRLLILQSMKDAENEDFNRAIEHVSYAITLSQKVKTESNHWLISYMVGIVMTHEALAWLHVLTTEFEVSSVHLDKIAKTFEGLPQYSNDSFSQIFAGEYAYSNQIIKEMLEMSFMARVVSFKEAVEYQLNVDSDSDFVADSAIEHLHNFLFTLFPKFYIHDNRMKSESAQFYKNLYAKSNFYCNDIDFEEGEAFPETEFRHLITPNSYSEIWSQSASVYEDYFYRRCFSQAHVEALRGIVGVIRYEEENGEYPRSLAQLVPDYLSVEPIDPFDGTAISYDIDGKYLYSVGKNISDDGGSLDSIYFKQCYEDDSCKNNPTFPIFGHSTLNSASNERCDRHP